MSETNRADKKKSLTEAEKKRLERFNKIAQDMEQQGYTRHDLTISIGKANLFAVLFLIPLFVIGYGLNYLVNHKFDIANFNLLYFLVAYVVLIVVHELIHGLFWGLSTPNHFKDIEFGVLRSSMTPYCTCLSPLSKPMYIFGSLMPMTILGIGLGVISIFVGNILLLAIGVTQTMGGAGDILITSMLIRYKTKGKDTILMDHPTQVGLVVFEK